MLNATGSFNKAAQAAGVNPKTLRKWRWKPEFREAFERWQKLNWSRQAYQGLRAKENLKESVAREEAKTGGLGGQNAPEAGGCYSDPPEPEKPATAHLHPQNKASNGSDWITQRMFEAWEEDQRRKAEQEASQGAEERPGFWCGS